VEDDLERHEQLETFLDRGRGACHLRQPDIGNLVDGAIRFYHTRYYELRAWVVMPNHVHLLFKTGTTLMSRIMAQLKEYTSREANKRLRRARGHFWAEGYWDTYMRVAGDELRTRYYIENNPTKAFLVQDSRHWLWTSARHRDEFGALRL
jgi:REP element-mobilizing transposase RayT